MIEVPTCTPPPESAAESFGPEAETGIASVPHNRPLTVFQALGREALPATIETMAWSTSKLLERTGPTGTPSNPDWDELFVDDWD